MWITIASILSALLGVSLGAVLSAFFHHQDWVNDQKKLEYRQLLDQLYETISVVTKFRPNLNPPNDPQSLNEAVQGLARIFEDRIFITRAIKSSGTLEEWLALKRVIYHDPGLCQTPPEYCYSLSNLHQREDDLRRKIQELVEKDIVTFGFRKRLKRLF